MLEDRTVALIGAPTDIGAGHRGGSMGPEALRVAGIEQAIAGQGCTVADRGNLVGPLNPWTPAINGYRHLAEVEDWCRSVHDAYYASLQAGELPVLLGGDHSLAIGSIAAAARHCREKETPLTVLWLDAHADYNTPETTPSGNIHGMPVAVLCGLGPDSLTGLSGQTPAVQSGQIVQAGIRSVDAVEKRMVLASDMEVFDMRRVDEMGMAATIKAALRLAQDTGGHLHVSFDVDFLDPDIAPGVGTTVSGGPNYREAQLMMEMIHESGLMASLDIMELNPAYDSNNKTARLVVELTESLFGKQILYRRPGAA